MLKELRMYKSFKVEMCRKKSPRKGIGKVKPKKTKTDNNKTRY